MKRLISILLALGMIFSAASAMAMTVSAEEYVNIPDVGLRLALQGTNIDDDGGNDGKFTAAQMARLVDFEIERGSAVKDLTGLEYCTNLKVLIAAGNPITNLDPIKNLKKLEELNIDNTAIEYDYEDYAYDVLAGYEGLSDISGLAGLTNLQHLTLTSNNISDISALKNLTKLTDIDLCENNVSDISPLANLTNLEWLLINVNNIVDISPLAKLKNLTDLDICNNKIHDISVLRELTNLEYLDIEDNFIGDPSALSSLTKLEDAYFGGNYFDLDDASVAKTLDGVAKTVAKNSGYPFENDYDNQGAAVKAATALKGESAADGIKLTWTNAAQAGSRKIDATQIFRYDSTGKPVKLATANGNATSYIDTTAEVGKEYTYAVRTCISYEGDYVTSCLSASAKATREAAAAVMYGDVDMNKTVDSNDALLALKGAIGLVELTSDQIKAADVDAETGLTSGDALSILKYSIGLIDKFPIERVGYFM